MDDQQVSNDKALLNELSALLASGLQTEWEQRAYTSENVNQVVSRLQDVASNDYVAKLQIGGFTDRPYLQPGEADLEESCATCMYYVRNRQFCELPELTVPVLPTWSCVLWRI